MPILPRNTPAKLFRKTAYDAYGQAVEAAPQCVFVNVVKFSDKSIATPLRSNMTASQGRADYDVASVILLFAWNQQISMGDRVVVYGTSLAVTNIYPQADVFGNLKRGHLTVSLELDTE